MGWFIVARNIELENSDEGPLEEPDLVDPDDLDDAADDPDEVDELDDDGLDDDDAEDGDVLDDEPEDVGATVVVTPGADTDDDDDDEEDEADEDDVEASLDVILKEKLVVADDDEDEPAETEDRAEVSQKVLPKQPDEFVCQSCFLVKHPSQLADDARILCRDCV